MIVFKTPLILAAAVLVPLTVEWFLHRSKRPTLRFSSLTLLPRERLKWGRAKWTGAVRYLRLAALMILCVGLAGPRLVSEHTEYKTEGVDIVLALDISGSMAAEDFTLDGKRVNRLDVVKRVVGEFIGARASDRIGLVAFSKKAYTVSPLTTDHDWLRQNLDRLRLGLIEDGTAIGSGVSSALLRLRDSQAKGKVAILLTDGMNNSGEVDPLAAAEAAQALNVRMYTIGAGSRGLVPFPVKDMWGRTVYQRVAIDLDEELLKKMADLTGGRYFRATDTESLLQVYREIDRLEKVEIEQYGYKEYKELFVPCVWMAFCLIALEIVLGNTVFLKLP